MKILKYWYRITDDPTAKGSLKDHGEYFTEEVPPERLRRPLRSLDDRKWLITLPITYIESDTCDVVREPTGLTTIGLMNELYKFYNIPLRNHDEEIQKVVLKAVKESSWFRESVSLDTNIAYHLGGCIWIHSFEMTGATEKYFKFELKLDRMRSLL